jgi:Fe-S-cluster containining protein
VNTRPPPKPPAGAPSPSTGRARLVARAKQWERDVVIPHCAACTKPCCALTDVVLDLSPAEAETLYRITKATQTLPPSVRAQGGRYFAHGAPCPAFSVSAQRCSIYDTGRKPRGCDDFPVYEDDDGLTADTRCEAVAAHLADLEEALFAALVPGETLAIARRDPAGNNVEDDEDDDDDNNDDDDVFVRFRVEQRVMRRPERGRTDRPGGRGRRR